MLRNLTPDQPKLVHRNISKIDRFLEIMEFHPSNLPIEKTFLVKDEKDASDAAEEMVKLGFSERQNGFKVLMPKEKKLAKRIGFTITTTVNFGLRKNNQERDIKYWTYHHDKENYAIVLISSKVLESLGY